MALVEIEFKGRRKAVFENPQEFPLNPGDLVIVRADRGEDLGRVGLAGSEWQEQLETLRAAEDEEELQPVLRLAGSEDVEQSEQNRDEEREARQFFREEVKRQGLEMKLVDVEYQLDRRKLTFYFTADGRVDFRELVKILAQHFRTRIDLRQIGARDESKRIGGMGICGREVCCATWIRDFKPVTTSMLKEQNLLLNPQKNTGLCGKLRCCLRYEVEQYREMNNLLPKPDTKVQGPRGKGRVEKVSLCQSILGVRWEDGHQASYGFEEFHALTNWDPDRKDELKVVTFKEDPTFDPFTSPRPDSQLVASAEPGSQSEGGREKDRGDDGEKGGKRSSSRRSRGGRGGRGRGGRRGGEDGDQEKKESSRRGGRGRRGGRKKQQEASEKKNKGGEGSSRSRRGGRGSRGGRNKPKDQNKNSSGNPEAKPKGGSGKPGREKSSGGGDQPKGQPIKNEGRRRKR